MTLNWWSLKKVWVSCCRGTKRDLHSKRFKWPFCIFGDLRTCVKPHPLNLLLVLNWHVQRIYLMAVQPLEQTLNQQRVGGWVGGGGGPGGTLLLNSDHKDVTLATRYTTTQTWIAYDNYTAWHASKHYVDNLHQGRILKAGQRSNAEHKLANITNQSGWTASTHLQDNMTTEKLALTSKGRRRINLGCTVTVSTQRSFTIIELWIRTSSSPRRTSKLQRSSVEAGELGCLHYRLEISYRHSRKLMAGAILIRTVYRHSFKPEKSLARSNNCAADWL